MTDTSTALIMNVTGAASDVGLGAGLGTSNSYENQMLNLTREIRDYLAIMAKGSSKNSFFGGATGTGTGSIAEAASAIVPVVAAVIAGGAGAMGAGTSLGNALVNQYSPQGETQSIPTPLTMPQSGTTAWYEMIAKYGGSLSGATPYGLPSQTPNIVTDRDPMSTTVGQSHLYGSADVQNDVVKANQNNPIVLDFINKIFPQQTKAASEQTIVFKQLTSTIEQLNPALQGVVVGATSAAANLAKVQSYGTYGTGANNTYSNGSANGNKAQSYEFTVGSGTTTYTGYTQNLNGKDYAVGIKYKS